MPFPSGKTVWLSALVAALLFVGFDAGLRLKSLETIAPAEAAARRQILESDDGYHWVMQTQQMLVGDTWRVRAVDYDNAPGGRAVHWSSPPRWWLAAVATAHAAWTGLPGEVAVEHAALYANTLLLGLFLLWLTPWTARHFGAWPAAALTLGLATAVPFAAEFGAGSFDHHGIAASCALVTVLGILAAWSARSGSEARGGFTVSALAGGFGLWVNAASQIPVLAGIGAGALLASWISRHEKNAPMPDAACWRRWGVIGGAVSLAAYLLEYFPAHLDLRLEANHPLHALAWLAAGDWLARCHQRGRSGAWFTSSRDRALGFAGLVALAAPFALALGWPAETFVVRDTLLWRLHADYIAEFASPLARLHGDGWSQLRTIFVHWNILPLLVGPVALAMIFRAQTEAARRAALVFAGAPALLLSVMALSQERWLGLALVGWLAVAVVLLRDREKVSRPGLVAALAALVILPYPALLASRAPAIVSGAVKPSEANRHQLALRDAAQWLDRRTPAGESLTVLSGPSATTSLIYFGRARGLGTLYWENLAGLRTTVDALGGTDADATRKLFFERGITHLVVASWASFARESARLHAGLRAGETPPADAFLLKLLNSRDTPPAWLRPLFYRLPPELAGAGAEFIFIFEYAPGQSPQLAAVRRAQFLAAHGSLDAATALLGETLAQHPGFAPALIALAQLHVQTRAVDAVRETLPRLRAALAAAPALEPEDRILASLVLAATRAPADARAQLDAAWRDLDERALRKLAPGTLRLLLRLSRDLQLTAPPALFALAETLQSADTPASAATPAPRN